MPQERDSAGVRIVTHGALDRAPRWHLADAPDVVLGTDDTAPLHLAWSARRLDRDEIAVANGGSREILLFDRGGRLLRRIGGPGPGPGEFHHQSLRIVAGDDRSIAVLELGFLWRLIHFTRQGEYTSEESRPTLSGHGLEDLTAAPTGTVVALSSPLHPGPYMPHGPRREPAALIRIGFTNDRADTLGFYPGAEIFAADVGPQPTIGGGTQTGPRLLRRLLAPDSRVAGGGDPWTFIVGDQAEGGFDVYSSEGVLILRTRWEPTEQILSPRDIAAATKEYLEQPVARRDLAAARRALRVVDSPERTPVFSELLVARDGAFWVRRYPLPGDPMVDWRVFSRAGLHAGTLTVPANLRVLEAGSDYLLARATDVLGVETIELWRFAR
ncbi:MAG: hypothetical protein R3E10_19415 [Gemmatimonadota bacterium]